MFKRALGLGVAIIIGAAVLASASGAATTSAQKVTKINVSTRAAVVHYLRSIHVSTKHVVIQRGLRNYAGAHCPGSRWTCASTKHTVVQIAKQGGQNRFVCRTSKCAVVQISGTEHGIYMAGRQASAAPNKSGGNSGICVKTGSGATSGGGQSCVINQSGPGLNTAGVYENTNKVSGLVQTAQYSASITQQSTGRAGTVGNKACVTQNINLDGSASNTNTKPLTVNLQGYQSVLISQDSFAGANSAQFAADSTGACTTQTLAQSQTLTSTVTTKGQITQLENAATPPNGELGNVYMQIQQNRSTGYKCTGTPPTLSCPSSANNTANFQQTMNQTAIANSLNQQTVTQTQSSQDGTGTPPNDSPPFSGLVAAINQDTSSSGQSIANPTQTETQCEDAAVSGLTQCSTTPDTVPFTVFQTQYGPVGIIKSPTAPKGRVPFAHKTPGDSAQTGGTNNVFNVTQTSTQNTDTGSNQKNTIAGGITTNGTGTVNQNTFIQGNNKQDVQQGDDTTVTGFINCNGSTNSACHKSLSKPVIDPSSEPTDPGVDNPTFTFTNADTTVTFECSLTGNAGDYTACDPGAGPGGSGSASYTDLPAGQTTFYVRSVDPDNGDFGTPATFTWTVLPISLSAFNSTGYTAGVAVGTDGSSAGWACQPSGPIALTTGSDPDTFGAISVDSAGGAINAIAEPTFAATHYAAGTPRYVLILSDGHTLFGYPPSSGLNGSAMAWEEFSTHPNVYVPWSTVVTDEGTATVEDAFVVADASQPTPYTSDISNLSWNGTNYNSGTCP